MKSSSTQLSESEFLKTYDSKIYEKPNSSVDVVIFSFFEGSLHVLTLKRAEHPFQGQWSLIGGFIDLTRDASLEETARRKLAEKTGVLTPYLEQVVTIGNPARDPRGWSMTTVYFALLPIESIHLRTGVGADELGWAKVVKGKLDRSLAFDHSEIVRICMDRFTSKTAYTFLPAHLMPKTFTFGELQETFEQIMGRKMDPKAFRRRILSAELIEETGREKATSTRPAKLYQLRKGVRTHYFSRVME